MLNIGIESIYFPTSFLKIMLTPLLLNNLKEIIEKCRTFKYSKIIGD